MIHLTQSTENFSSYYKFGDLHENPEKPLQNFTYCILHYTSALYMIHLEEEEADSNTRMKNQKNFKM